MVSGRGMGRKFWGSGVLDGSGDAGRRLGEALFCGSPLYGGWMKLLYSVVDLIDVAERGAGKSRNL